MTDTTTAALAATALQAAFLAGSIAAIITLVSVFGHLVGLAVRVARQAPARETWSYPRRQRALRLVVAHALGLAASYGLYAITSSLRGSGAWARLLTDPAGVVGSLDDQSTIAWAALGAITCIVLWIKAVRLRHPSPAPEVPTPIDASAARSGIRVAHSR